MSIASNLAENNSSVGCCCLLPAQAMAVELLKLRLRLGTLPLQLRPVGPGADGASTAFEYHAARRPVEAAAEETSAAVRRNAPASRAADSGARGAARRPAPGPPRYPRDRGGVRREPREESSAARKELQKGSERCKSGMTKVSKN